MHKVNTNSYQLVPDSEKESLNFLYELFSEVTLSYWSYSNHHLNAKIISSNDEIISLHAITDIVLSDSLLVEDILNVCNLEVTNLHQCLPQKNGYYVPPDGFDNLMKYRCMSSLYGRKICYKYFISFKGYHRLLSFPLKQLSDLEIHII